MANLLKNITPEQMKSPEFLDVLTDTFVETLRSKTQVYSKEGLLPDEVVNIAFEHMQKRSLEGELAIYDSQPIRVFTFQMDESIVRSFGGEEFYRIFSRKLADFVGQIPEYAKADHVKRVLEKLRGEDFSQVYGESNFYFEGGKIAQHMPLFRTGYDFAPNLVAFLSANFANPLFRHDEKLPKNFPSLVPVFNFQWPETLNGEEAEKAVEALRSYAGKRRHRYDHSKQEIVLDKNGDVTPYVMEMADKNGQMFNFVLGQLRLAGGLTQIVAAPLYGVKAIPSDHDLEGQSWTKSSFSNQAMRGVFKKYKPQRV